MKDLRPKHQKQIDALAEELKGNTKRIKIKKKTISNLFRYDGRKEANVRQVDLSEFNQPLYLDERTQTLEVQGLTTYEDIVDYTLPHGLLPTITPELKNITVGGVTVGIGIESNCYRYGFVHDGLLEADVLLPDGTVVTCSANNKYSDLFYGLPNSYGTLGYVLRAKIQLRPIKKYVHLYTRWYNSAKELLAAIKVATGDPKVDYIDSLVYNQNRLYLTTSHQTDTPKNLRSIYGQNIFYKEIGHPGEFCLTTRDYIFRYDPEWFWNLPETRSFNLFRKLAPQFARSSGFYTKYNVFKAKFTKQPEGGMEDKSLEKFIQDWEVPWEQADKLLNFAFQNINLEWRPWLITAIKTPAKASCYPMKKDHLYMNLGAYSFAKKKAGKPAYYNTKIMDEFCFKHGGIKMLYSSSFLSQNEFNNIYNGKTYLFLKKKYDPQNLLPTVFEKTVKSY